jgi:hypothetical protein
MHKPAYDAGEARATVAISLHHPALGRERATS